MMPEIVVAPAEILDAVLPDTDYRDELVEETARGLVEVLMNTPHAAAVAANQIGSRARMLAYWDNSRTISVLLNPFIVKRSTGTRFGNEGCLSFPDQVFRVERANKVVVSSVNQDGERTHTAAHGFQSRVLQHEIDHLDGILVPSRAVGAHAR